MYFFTFNNKRHFVKLNASQYRLIVFYLEKYLRIQFLVFHLILQVKFRLYNL